MFVTLAVLLLALGGFTALVVRRVRPDPQRGMDADQLRGFCYVGAVGVGAVGVAVVIVGLTAGNDRLAEGVALLGFFGYVLYTVAALVITTWPPDRWPRRLSRRN